jgi:threonylcarbamoyladenosine tRNA methylthiotransferase MtaB
VSGAEIVSFGCRLNIAEGEAIREAAGDADDLIIFNTCAVTAEAERQARQAIRKAARANPDKRIIVTGCGAEISRSTYEAMPEVAGVVGNLGKSETAHYHTVRPELVEACPEPRRGGLSFTSFQKEGQGFDKLSPNRELRTAPPALSGIDHARAFVEVQNGCDHDCTFCVTTLARGPSRSVPAGGVIDAIKAVVARGQLEAVLTAVDLTSYGAGLPGQPTLGLLVERILKAVPELPRLRLSSLDCIEIDDRLFDLIAHEPRLMPHLHLSLQSGDDMILKRMKRRHSRADAVQLVQRLKAARPELTIGADLIAGFPTEDDAMFANTLALLDDADIVLTHIFPYSPRPGTAAARMPQLAKVVAKERATRLRDRAETRQIAWLETLIGSVQPVLIENRQSGHAPNFAKVRMESPAAPRGTLLPLRITGRNGQTLLGAPA